MDAFAGDLCAGSGGQFRQFLQGILDSQPFRFLSSTPTKKTRSVRRFLVSINAFKSGQLCVVQTIALDKVTTKRCG